MDDADIVIVATNHSDFEGMQTLQAILARVSQDCLLVDPWNVLGTAQVFAYAPEVAALRGVRDQPEDLRELR